MRLVELSQANLFMDIGMGHFCFAVMVNDTSEFVAMEYYSLKPNRRVEEIQTLLNVNNLLRNSYNRVFAVYNNPECVLVPESFYNPETNDSVLNLVHGDLDKGLVLSEEVPHLGLFNIYRVSRPLFELLDQKFPTIDHRHYYSAWLKSRKSFTEVQTGDHLHVIFYPYKIIAALFHNNILELIQSFPYDIPEDVSYHLLNISEQFRLPADKLRLHISGLLDTNSAMYTEILKYFLNVDLETRSRNFNYDFAFDSYPQHFFTPIFSLAVCE